MVPEQSRNVKPSLAIPFLKLIRIHRYIYIHTYIYIYIYTSLKSLIPERPFYGLYLIHRSENFTSILLSYATTLLISRLYIPFKLLCAGTRASTTVTLFLIWLSGHSNWPISKFRHWHWRVLTLHSHWIESRKLNLYIYIYISEQSLKPPEFDILLCWDHCV